MDSPLRKLMISIMTTPWVAEHLIRWVPYLPYIKACTYLVIGDVITGILAACYEKYGSLHPAFLFKTFRSTKLIKKFMLAVLFFVGLHYIDVSDILLIKLGMSQSEAGIWWCVCYGLYELTSILENFGRLDFPIAKQIKNWINSKVPEEMRQEDKKDDSKS